jgi:glycosyltransferase EpsE
MEDYGKVSVIMGIYNCAPTLRESIDSILSQTYSNFQLILCDDASKDDTYKIAQDYKIKNPDKIILIKNDENLGLSKTLNNCLKYADGKFIARMDGDDISMPDRFEKQVDFLVKNPKYIVCGCAVIPFDENGEYCVRYHPNDENIKHKRGCIHATLLCRREMYDRLGGYCEEWFANRCEDQYLWYSLSTNEDMFTYNLDEPLYKVREDRNTYSRRTFKNAFTTSVCLFKCYRMMHFPIYKYISVLRPFGTAIMPYWFMKRYHDWLDKKKSKDR